MGETTSEDRKLLNTIHSQMSSVISMLDEREKSSDEFKRDIKSKVKDIELRVKELELTGATNDVMMGNLNQIKSSLIKWFMGMFLSGVVGVFAIVKFVI